MWQPHVACLDSHVNVKVLFGFYMVIKVVTRGLVEFMIIEAKLAANKSSFRGFYKEVNVFGSAI